MVWARQQVQIQIQVSCPRSFDVDPAEVRPAVAQELEAGPLEEWISSTT